MERLWPRGISRQAARLTGWLKDLAPSAPLRQWYRHDPVRWAEFQQRYRAELRAPDKQAKLHELAARAARTNLTLVFAARDLERNSARLLAQEIARY